MKQIEKEIEDKCCAYARQHGWTAVKMEKCGHKGIPDRLFLHPDGSFRLVEFKKDEKQKPRPEQQTWLDRFRSFAFLIGSFDDFIKLNW